MLQKNSWYIPNTPEATLAQLDFLAESICLATQQPRNLLFFRDSKSFSKFVLQSAFVYIARNHLHCNVRQIEAYLNVNYHMIHKRIILLSKHMGRLERGEKVPFVQTFTIKLVNHLLPYLQEQKLPEPPHLIFPDSFDEEQPQRSPNNHSEVSTVVRYKTKHGYIDSRGQIILRPPE